MKKEKETNKSGFTLLELIIVISIMGVLTGLIAPQIVRYVTTNRATACEADREAILAVYERCIYGQTKDLDTASLQQVMTGLDAATSDEVLQYVNCPSGGSYTGEVTGDVATAVYVATIKCDHPGHEDVVVDFVGWSTVELAEGIDEPFPEPPPAVIPPPEETESEEETSIVEEEPVDSSYWPYANDNRWDGIRFPGQVIYINTPSKVETSKEGNQYVIVDRDGSGKFPVYWEWNLGPENIDTRGWESCITCSGVVIEDLAAFTHPNSPTQLTGINYGDIVVYKGKKYIYGSHYGSEHNAYQDYPVEGTNGNNFYLIAQ